MDADRQYIHLCRRWGKLTRWQKLQVRFVLTTGYIRYRLRKNWMEPFLATGSFFLLEYYLFARGEALVAIILPLAVYYLLFALASRKFIN